MVLSPCTVCTFCDDFSCPASRLPVPSNSGSLSVEIYFANYPRRGGIVATGNGVTLAVWTLMSALWFLPVRANTFRERSLPQEELNGLRDLMTTGMSAAREADHAKLEEIARNLMIPDYATWFKATFGKEQGTKLTTTYRTNFERDQGWIPKLFEWLSKQQGELEVQDANQLPRNMANSCGKALMDAEKSNTVFYRMDLRKKDNSGFSTVSSAGYFVLVQGAFRTAGLQITRSESNKDGGRQFR